MQDKLVELEKKYDVDWREYNLEELFGKSTRGRRLKSQDRVVGNLPFVTAGEADTGISAYIGNKVQVFSENTITIDMFGSAKYRGYQYGADDHIAVVHTEQLSKNVAQYIAAAIHKSSHAGQFDYSRNFYATDADELNIQLPTQKDEIAYKFMDEFVETLEAERLQTLEAYLQVTGLKNTVLTDAECESLARLDTVGGAESIRWREFNLPDLFSIKNTHNILSRNIVENSGTIPYLTAGQGNNAVGTYISHDASQIDEGNSIFIGGKTFVVTYQERDYFSNDSHNLALYYREYDKRTKENQLFMATAIYKSLSHLYSWGNSISRSKIQNDTVALPVRADGEIDFDFMSNLIRAMQKVVIKGVVDWADKRIEAMRGVVGI